MHYGEVRLTDGTGKTLIRLYHSTVGAGERPFSPHHHTECELAVINSGKGEYRMQNQTYRFSAGDVFLFNGEEIHCITRIEPGEVFDVTNVHFEPSLLWSEEGFGSTRLLRIFFDRSDAFENKVDPRNPATPRIAQAIGQMERELTEKPFEYELAVRNLLSDSLILLSRWYGYIREDSANAGCEQNAERLSGVLEYIGEHLTEDIRLEELAAVCRMNKTYFCSVFKQYNGISPFDYIIIKRVERAVALLKTSDRTVVDIAADCGFRSLSNFYKAFLRVTGKTPGKVGRRT